MCQNDVCKALGIDFGFDIAQHRGSLQFTGPNRMLRCNYSAASITIQVLITDNITILISIVSNPLKVIETFC